MTKLPKHRLYLASLLGGLLLSAAWPERGFAPLLFIGFIPFLFIEDYILRHRERFSRFSVFFYIYPGFLLWNVLTTWWIWNSTSFGSILAWMLNSLFMAATLTLFHLTRREITKRSSQLMLIFFWVMFEYWHHNWEGTWPWLSLGNGFAHWHQWIQWYEYTGIFGGTLLILLINILIYKSIQHYIDKRNLYRILLPSCIAALTILLAVSMSYRLYHRYHEPSWHVDIIVVQPNIDPYNEQYSLPPAEVLKINFDLALAKMDEKVEFVVSPESAIQENIWEDRLEQSYSLDSLSAFLKRNPHTGYVIGASTFRNFEPDEKLSPTARKYRHGEGHYDAYNTAIYLTPTDEMTLHHKSKLTPGVEKMPFARLMKPLESMALNLGGTVGSLGTDPVRTVFTRPDDGLKIAPVICYESVFGEYVTEYIKKGANLIFVITNDGWWGDTPGHRQHFTFSRLRAIETRRSIARSANTGISAFIDQRGDAFHVTRYWEPDVIRQTINANDKMTFYVQYGDYIGRLSSFVAIFLVLIALSFRLKRKKIRPLEFGD
ncbi:MAG: apolipoprotein N-acyltransferase [Bacteroidales bacterium]|nr:apolipoprotein N-acyltransferase [Bacteroidales bacterium]